MSTVTKLFAGLSGVIHVLFFLMESVFWTNPTVFRIFTVANAMDAETIEVFIKNQGFYNLFLALGIFTGLALITRYPLEARTLIMYICLVMIGASIVLLFTVPAMLNGVFIQGLPPLLALITLRFNRASKQAP